jgi:hypothetical protein
VTDIDHELRELFRQRSEEVPLHREVPRTLLRRARRRIALNAVAVGLGVVVVASGAFAGVRAISGLPGPQPAASVNPPPTQPGPSASPTGACTSAQLRAIGSLQGAAGSRDGELIVTNLSGQTCTLRGRPTITLLDPSRNPITSGVTFTNSPAGWFVDGSPKPSGWPVVTLKPGDAASVRLGWSNWCADGGDAPLWRIGIPDGGTVNVTGMETVPPPPCNGPGQPSTIERGPFEPRAGP